jgi:nicotinamidase-related amidase
MSTSATTSASPAESLDGTALVVVDVQPDFLPGGALAVPEGDAILAPLRDLLARLPFGLAVATQDWHPRGHVSFASAHAGRQPFEQTTVHGHPQVLWPDHCVQGTPGAELGGDLPWERVSAVIRKGAQQDVDSYSVPQQLGCGGAPSANRARRLPARARRAGGVRVRAGARLLREVDGGGRGRGGLPHDGALGPRASRRAVLRRRGARGPRARRRAGHRAARARGVAPL